MSNNLTSDTAINDSAIPSKCFSFIGDIFENIPIVINYISISFTFALSAVELRFTPLEAISGKKTAIWDFGLTDEFFATATTKFIKDQPSWSENWMSAIAIYSWLSWVLGTVACALIGVILFSIPVAILAGAGTPDVMQEHNKFFSTLTGCLIICACFYKTRSIIITTLFGAAIFGLTFKVFMN
ncbi:AzlC family ABC transporter permease [Xenorhabdus budapestensis]|uniref:AzlC family ABC transporter permease n=1 Tax=Xenorhabdus budapestensis TaxID=290110 RepID=UPI003145423D